jgi:outer membrane protease
MQEAVAMIAMHSQDENPFLGLRQGRAGGYEIVYEATKTGKSLIWPIKNSLVTEGDITQQLERALAASTVLETLYASLRSADIEVELYVAQTRGRN